MRKVVVGLLGASLVTGVGVMLPTAASAAPPVEPPAAAPASKKAPLDDLPNPLEEKRRELREQAINGLVDGSVKTEKRGGSTVAKVGKTYGRGDSGRRFGRGGKDQYVELGREQTDKVFVILAEFGDERHPDFPDVDSDPATPGPTTWDGPLHNAIPAPDRSVDNSTIWQDDYSREHYEELYFGEGRGAESLKTYYEAQSSGRYSVEGEVSDWVKVQYNEARYGRDCNAKGVCSDTFMWNLVTDAANQWAADRKAAGRTDAQIKAEMEEFDQYDRYDFDGDGVFNEADGYIDHFQIIHAGGDQADGDPYQGEDAIWSHRWYAYNTSIGITGPATNRAGGTQIGNTGIWIGDYTTQAENTGLSTVAHEYGHDLGLPDDYDTSGGSNMNSEYWTLMAQSRLSGRGEPIGTKAGDLGAWNKLQLGWLDTETVQAGQKRTMTLGPQEYNSKNPQALLVNLPPKEVTRDLGAPYAGAKQFFSGNDDDLENTMSTTVDLSAATTASLSLKGRYNIELDYDYLYVEASTNGVDWTALDGTVNNTPFLRDGSDRPAIGGTTDGKWADIVVPLDAYKGQKPQLRFLYRTDGGLSAGGFFGDDITITVNGAAVATDGAEGTPTWTLDGFTVEGATFTDEYTHFYLAGNRTYVSYDKYLKTGPYNFGWATTKPDWVEHYSYQQGLLISYTDTSIPDNNTNVHPGEGRNLIIDAHPQVLYRADGLPWRSRVQMYDAPFSLRRTDSMVLHVNGEPNFIRGQKGQPLFDDTKQYFYEDNFAAGVKLPAVGVKIKVLKEMGTSVKVQVS